ncbi:MAG: hypothetical protein R8G66_07820 [Cytophagales bacterium]|nr:hypothetical protein [Cytophagales bacterium]
MKPEFIPNKRPLEFVRIVLCLILFHLILAETSAQQTIPVVQNKDGFWTRDGNQQVIKFDSIDAADDGNDRITFYADELRVLDPDDGRELFNLGASNSVTIGHDGRLRYLWDDGTLAYDMFTPAANDLFFLQFHEPGVNKTVFSYDPKDDHGKIFFPNTVLTGVITNNPAEFAPPKLILSTKYGTNQANETKFILESDDDNFFISKQRDNGSVNTLFELTFTSGTRFHNEPWYFELDNGKYIRLDLDGTKEDHVSFWRGHGSSEDHVGSFGMDSTIINGALFIRPKKSDDLTWQVKNTGDAIKIGSVNSDGSSPNEILKITEQYVVIRNDVNNSLTLDPTLALSGGANFYSVNNIRIGAGQDGNSKGKAHILITGGEKEPVLIRYNPTTAPITPTWDTKVKDGFALAVEKGILSEDLAIAEKGQWADYVFEEDYQPMPLEELEKFVKEEKHLPGIISEPEIEADGFYQVHDAMVGQLKNLEEQVLHNIAQEKTIKIQAAQIKNLTQKLNQLEKLVQQLADKAGN